MVSIQERFTIKMVMMVHVRYLKFMSYFLKTSFDIWSGFGSSKKASPKSVNPLTPRLGLEILVRKTDSCS